MTVFGSKCTVLVETLHPVASRLVGECLRVALDVRTGDIEGIEESGGEHLVVADASPGLIHAVHGGVGGLHVGEHEACVNR